MARVQALLSVLRHAAASGFADYAVMFTWRTWSTAWLSRVVVQVIFFALIGRLLGDDDLVRYLIVGNVAIVTATEAMQTVASTTWERRAGTLPLLVASPTHPIVVFVGRSVQWLPSGVASATIALVVSSVVFDVSLPWPRAALVPLLLAVVAVSTYLFATLAAALVLRAMDLRNIVSNATTFVMMAVCGVNVPVDALPAAIRPLAAVLPLTHGLDAIRALLDGGPAGEVAQGAVLALLVGAAWFAPAAWSIRRLVDRGRRDGTIEFAA